MTIADDFTLQMTNILNPTLITNIASAINATSTISHSTIGTITNEIYYMKFYLFCDSGRCLANCLNIAVPSNIDLSGSIYSNNFGSLYSGTRQAIYLFMPSYVAIIFCDIQMQYLGYFMSNLTLNPGYTSIISDCIWISP